MKKTRKALSTVLVTMLLVGCSAQPALNEPEVPTQDVPVLQATEPEKPEIAVTEETVPVRETQSTQPTSPTVTTEPQETKPDTKREDGASPKSEKPAEQPQTAAPKETTPKETVPKETVPVPTEPRTTEPPVTEAPETEPPATEPPVTEPAPTEPAPTETVPEETEPTEPPAESIDTAALEAYGRSYASSTYGYNGTSACTPGTGAGYFPAATKKITSMEEGRSIVRQAIDSQYKRDKAYGYLPYEEIDGKTVRCPINVSVSSAGGNTYTITVYYGGTA